MFPVDQEVLEFIGAEYPDGYGEATFSYRVPRDARAGQTLDFVADVYDWADNRTTESFYLVVEEEWEGELTLVATHHHVGVGLLARQTYTMSPFAFTVRSARGTETV